MTKIGLFGIGLDTYWDQFDGLLDRLIGYQKQIANKMETFGAVVIDAGYHPEKCGDIDLENIESKASAYTPVPGGVGPMTRAALMMNTMKVTELS